MNLLSSASNSCHTFLRPWTHQSTLSSFLQYFTSNVYHRVDSLAKLAEKSGRIKEKEFARKTVWNFQTWKKEWRWIINRWVNCAAIVSDQKRGEKQKCWSSLTSDNSKVHVRCHLTTYFFNMLQCNLRVKKEGEKVEKEKEGEKEWKWVRKWSRESEWVRKRSRESEWLIFADEPLTLWAHHSF